MTLPTPPRWRVFLPLALGTVMATLDISVVNLALPTIARDLHAPLAAVAWVVLAYVLAITGLLLTLGRLADRVGRRALYAAGLVGFASASALCAAAPSAGWLIAARALQGFGAAMMAANSTALLVAAFPGAERGRALGAFGAVVGVGLALGPPLGGWIVSALSWRWIFLVNLPIGVLALALVFARVPRDARRSHSAALEPMAAGLWCVGLTLLMLALSLGPEIGWRRPLVGLSAAGAVLTLALFAWSEHRSREPLLPWSLLGGTLGPAALLTLLGQMLSMAVAFVLPLYFEDVVGFEPRRAGSWLVVLPLASLLCAPLAGRWADRLGPRPLVVGGLLVAAAGDLVLSRMGGVAHGYFFGAALLGVGLGAFSVPNASAVMGAVPPESLGLASGLQATMRNLGIAAGTAAAAAVTATLYSGAAHRPLLGAEAASTDAAALARAVAGVFVGLAALGVLAAFLGALAPGSRGKAAAPDHA